MRLVVSTFLTLDGVMQAPGGPDEDRDDGFDLGGWSFPYFDEDMGQTVGASLDAASGLILGRRTYEIFAAHWPHVSEEHEDGAVARTLNALPKYVASTTLHDPAWANTTVLSDVAAGVRDLKAGGEGELNVQGSSNLLQTLQREGLVDEYRLWACPVVLGRGKRLFASGSTHRALELLETRANSKGAVYSVYRTAGPPETGSCAAPELG